MTKEIQLTTSLRTKLLSLLMTGVPLSKLCKEKEMPSLSKVYSWIAKHPDFAKDLLQARRCGAQSYIDKAIEALDTADNTNIHVVREKANMARWMAAKLIPAYGDKQQIVQDTKVEITWNIPNEDKEMKVVNSSVL
jgi:spermidine/putrescine-binding protein